jgi:hypothetical protein
VLAMMKLIRRITSRLFRRTKIKDQPDRRPHGPLLSMLENDLHNLDKLTHALTDPKR